MRHRAFVGRGTFDPRRRAFGGLETFVRTLLAAALAAVIAVHGAGAQEAAGEEGDAAGEEPAPAGEACAGPEHRRFDFWVGSWTVIGADGEVAGENSITPILEGCALREEWRGARGGGEVTGTSYSAYDARRDVWHQTWVDRNGLLLLIEGGPDGEGGMILSGEVLDPDGSTSVQRITWTPVAPDTVRQHWQRSGDGGKTWRTVFDGTYRKAQR